jgi:Domain of unknown function (DUF4357)
MDSELSSKSPLIERPCMNRPQTIQIYLPLGDPRSIRVAEITTRIIRVIEVPRSQLAEFLKMPEAQQVGVYFLIGELSEAGLTRAYIGQSGNVGNRLVQHNQSKDFWNRVLVVVSLTNSLTQTHALFLEWFALAEVAKAGRYNLENGNAGARPYTPAPLEADCHEIHETAATLLATLGQPMFEPLRNAASAAGVKELFYCKGVGADGVGEYTPEGFLVLKGSIVRVDGVASLQPSSERLRSRLQAEGVIVLHGDGLVFARDHLFASPSTAGVVVLGRPVNGWDVWKNSLGKTLNELKRQPVLPID